MGSKQHPNGDEKPGSKLVKQTNQGGYCYIVIFVA
jgi:hypothetical protein